MKNNFADTEPPIPKKFEGLSDLMMHAEHYSWWTLKYDRQISPIMALLTENGKPALFPWNCKGDFSDPAVRDQYAVTCRMAAAALRATATVLITESWMSRAIPGQPFDAQERPSEALGRQEIVACVGESLEGPQARILPIIRHNGQFFGFGKDDLSQDIDLGATEGRFTRLLPPRNLPPEMKQAALRGLKMLGYKVAQM
ncbi:MAG: hypothetical protein WCS42_19625 [Verrucomicrobiota bacterium]